MERQREGIQAAKAAGAYKSHAPTARKQFAAVLPRLQAGAKRMAVAAELGISRTSVYRIAATAEGAFAA